MPYVLAFWRDADDRPRDPNAVYDAICDGQIVDGLATLPIADIVQRVRDTFDPILPRADDVAWEAGQDMFMLERGAQHILFVAGHSTSTDHHNTMIDVMKTFGCPLYDPQTQKRYFG